MNDRYLFRGKRADNMEWVEGLFFKTPLTSETWEADHFGMNKERWCISDQDGVVYEVIPETVGQWTGLKDRNGNKIFEGDIMKTDWQNRVGVIDFVLGEFVLKEGMEVTPLSRLIRNKWKLEVIGSVHDNPELLEGA